MITRYELSALLNLKNDDGKAGGKEGLPLVTIPAG